MKSGRWLAFIGLVSLWLAACSVQEESVDSETVMKTTPQMYLLDHPDGDIFAFENVVYENAEDIEWMRKLELEIGEKVLEITGTYHEGEDFGTGIATNLPVGTEIFELQENNSPVLIAVVGDQKIPYIGLKEG
ncbi:hypothetical protein [Thalassobacillus pellis]|uniref:hypothetical protein n=1 Tax=Thalassobacillus pellis TaxID=748008 RepID=UPI001960B64C|nr:hypothetical protein [Thalassobacillus pellis]MBM7552245.1 hypothetical protein [Thalassobacillus pellis]